MKSQSNKNINNLGIYDQKIKIKRKNKNNIKISDNQINDLSSIERVDTDNGLKSFFNEIYVENDTTPKFIARNANRDRCKTQIDNADILKQRSNHFLKKLVEDKLSYIQEESLDEEQNEHNTLVVSKNGLIQDYFKNRVDENQYSLMEKTTICETKESKLIRLSNNE